jgi:hypothetical protein
MDEKPASLKDELLASLTPEEAERLTAENELDDFRHGLTMGGDLMISMTGAGFLKLSELAKRAERKPR